MEIIAILRLDEGVKVVPDRERWRMLKGESLMRVSYGLIGLMISVVLISCASSSNNQKSTQSELSEYLVLGSVVFPSQKPVTSAQVWTDPPTLSLLTDSEGQFRIDQGLQPTKYTFYAEYEGNEGSVEALVTANDTLNIAIQLNEHISLTTQENTGKRTPTEGYNKDKRPK